jgi:hypothetical protein
MKLTEKAKDAFEKWLEKEYKFLLLEVKGTGIDVLTWIEDSSMFNALIIEWLESVNLFIGVDTWRTSGNLKETFYWYNVKDINQESFIKDTYEESLITSRNKSRQEATNIAIEKANEIYNNN